MHCTLLDVMGNVKKREHVDLGLRDRIMKWRKSGKDICVEIRCNLFDYKAMRIAVVKNVFNINHWPWQASS